MNWKNIRDAIAAIGNERRQIANAINEKRGRREFLLTAPQPLEEHLQRLDDLIDAEAREFSERMRQLTRSKEHKPGQPYPVEMMFTMGNNSAKETQRALCGLFREGVKRGIRDVAATWDYPPAESCGPPMGERIAELETLDREIADLESRIQKIDEEAAASSVRLDGGAVPMNAQGPKVGRGKIDIGWQSRMDRRNFPVPKKDKGDGGSEAAKPGKDKGDGVKVTAAEGAEDMVNAESDAGES